MEGLEKLAYLAQLYYNRSTPLLYKIHPMTEIAGIIILTKNAFHERSTMALQ